jgi:CDGSH-type Zn-finger protein
MNTFAPGVVKTTLSGQTTNLKKYLMSKTKLTINSNGSVKIDGDFEIVDTAGNAYGLQGRTIVSLCRCGRSSNKPFCDGSHKGHFEHEAVAFELPPKKV